MANSCKKVCSQKLRRSELHRHELRADKGGEIISDMTRNGRMSIGVGADGLPTLVCESLRPAPVSREVWLRANVLGGRVSGGCPHCEPGDRGDRAEAGT